MPVKRLGLVALLWCGCVTPHHSHATTSSTDTPENDAHVRALLDELAAAERDGGHQ